MARFQLVQVFINKVSRLRRKRACHLLLAVAVAAFLVMVMSFLLLLILDGGEKHLPLYRDLYVQEPWPDVEGTHSAPGQIPGTVHYIWCGSKQFRFQHYLGLLSAVRILQPVTLVFHYTHLPQVDRHWYNTWFQELKQSVHNLQLRPLHGFHTCRSKDMRSLALKLIQKDGGIFLGENTILTRFPKQATSESVWYSILDETLGFMIASRGFDDFIREIHFDRMPYCGTADMYNAYGASRDMPCVILTENLYPRDIWDAETPLAELCRWLYYGERAVRLVEEGQGEPIPRISHYVWLKPTGFFGSNEFKFLHYLSVLSALHVGGFRHVYVHGEAEPEGAWWEGLRGENVTFVRLLKTDTVFQQAVKVPAHVSDIIRIEILHKYGGVYQDRDVVWVSRVPGFVLSYPTVATLDWPRYGEWPETFNLGVLMSRRHAPWLRHFLSTLRYYRDDKFEFNACLMSYRAYEWHPESLYVDNRGQTICFRDVCHPTWHDDYQRDLDSEAPVGQFHWSESRAFHFTWPKIPQSLQSPQAVRDGTDIYAHIGRHVLEKGGRDDLLRKP